LSYRKREETNICLFAIRNKAALEKIARKKYFVAELCDESAPVVWMKRREEVVVFR